MSDETILPPSVGRMDPVVEAIREGGRFKAGKPLQDEFSRLYNKVASIDADLEKAMNLNSGSTCERMGSDERHRRTRKHRRNCRDRVHGNRKNERGIEMSEQTILPPSVGRLDPVVDAIRDGDWLAAEDVLIKEWNRREHECQQDEIRLEKRKSERDAIFNFMVLVTNLKERPDGEQVWRDIRKACGWSGVDGFEGPVEGFSREFILKHADAEDEIQGGLTAGYQPALKAEKLPKLTAQDVVPGFVMTLGGTQWHAVRNSPNGLVFEDFKIGRRVSLDMDEIQELIERGVRFEIPEGGA